MSHPHRGETAAVVRGALLERAWTQIAAAQPAAPPADRPPVVQRGLPPLPADQRERARQLARQAEDRLFAADGGDVLFELEQPLFRLRGGCAVATRKRPHRTSGPDDLPVTTPCTHLPRPLGGLTFPHERLRRDRHRPAQRGRPSGPLVPVLALQPRAPPDARLRRLPRREE